MENRNRTFWRVWGAAALVLAILQVRPPAFIFPDLAIGAAAVMLRLAFATLPPGAWLVLRRLFAPPRGQIQTFGHDISD